MKLKKLIVNALAVVGTVVIVDNVINAISNNNTKEISKKFLNDFDLETVLEEENELALTNHYSNGYKNYEGVIFPDIKKYEAPNGSGNSHSFQYTIKTDVIKNDTADEPQYNEPSSEDVSTENK